ncbi:hypothetical protein SS1G_06002 [Sclerotinia sclerotiorum 1980 UF-70]|uniref:Uncharacterized protein n=2 Tax=Sclerotinia sclerotiorum (strain ATCC 18683 / 1980 / Ss-1) TaxID=665079 RepID=A7EL05_SCLS1|nr:hypothetical protein SS1G_06002 [Sclerotinia sclerotiorum 1980 UF-70]APA09791.1 hypothetical protein sscle_05g045610 [Sclerotinia sclerotiorum 1980 UF-70]EDO03521.1 hypothetical protein SS1G_06002 [Sclerotinia sclerotiorum 1980 UF-70]
MDQATRIRKRKAETQDNGRLSKRLSLLNLENNGQKLYVPVEQPILSSDLPATSSATTTSNYRSTKSKKIKQQDADDVMQLDDSKHKVYIYNLDDELSDSDASDDGRLVFLPDISKHLRGTRIPPHILANKDGELAGVNNQLILYDTAVPRNHNVPEEQDLVRKAFLDAREKARAKWDERARLEGRGGERTMGEVVPDGASANSVSEEDAGVEDMIVEDDPDAMDLG